MKISKVEHTKSAVGNSNNGTKGFLYKNPARGKNIDIKKQIQDCGNKSQFLYNLFVPVQAGVKPNEPKADDSDFKKKNYKIKKANYDRRVRCAKSINYINKTLKRNILFDKRNFNENDKILENMQNPANKLSMSNELARDIIELALRSSLKKFPDYKEAAVLLSVKAGQNNISEEEKTLLFSFFDFIRSDYNRMDVNDKNSDGARIVRSIENQNMVIQPKDDVLTLSVPSKANKRTSHKVDEKNGFDLFLKEYANLNENDRDNLLRALRRLVDLYFSAPEIINEATQYIIPASVDTSLDFDVFSVHERNKNNTAYFVEVPEILLGTIGNNLRLDTIKQKEAMASLKESIRNKNMVSYRYSKRVIEMNIDGGLFFRTMDTNMFWVHHIESAVERILKKVDITNFSYRLSLGYLTEKVWKDALNTISIKYIAIGKAVYNFAMDDLYSDGDIALGNISESAINGINSFDYEMIKAKETLQRELAVNVAYSANNLARTTVDMSGMSEKDSDFLLWRLDKIAENIKGECEEDTLRNILQFFGGISNWDINIIKESYAGKNADNYAVAFLNDIKDIIYSMRNESFHFTTASINKGSWNKVLIAKMFEIEASRCIRVQKDSLYTNNLSRYYRAEDLEKVLNHIYKNNSTRDSQVPSYGNLVVRKTFPDFLTEKLGLNREKAYSTEELDKWQSAVYYLIKEIYYNSYLQSDRAKSLFLDACYKLKGDPQIEKSDQAVDNFKKRINEIKEYSLSEICQNLMTEYNSQNNNRKVRSSKDSLFDKELFKHYKILLHQTLAEALAQYIKGEEVFNFIFRPLTGNAIKEIGVDDFLPNWTSPRYEALVNNVNENVYLQKWYMTAKFLNPKMLNLLAGSLRSYIQYVQDIEKRAKETNNYLHVKADNLEDITQAVSVLDMCNILAANVSNELTDYFASQDEYASYLRNFISYTDSKENVSFRDFEEFCNSGEYTYDIYMDAKNPRPNRNIIMSKLYAPDLVLKNVIKPVERKDIDEFYSLKDNILQYKTKGVCSSVKEQKILNNYQRTKNLVELRDVVEYGEIINNLLGQLVNWSFIRERDLLYFQLGFHYLCLKNASFKPNGYGKIDGADKDINGAILSQIAGMYINGIPVYSIGKDKLGLVPCTINGGAGSKIGAFLKYTKEIIKDTELAEQGNDSIYNAGLEVFENINEHDNITDIRNYIDHFRFYINDNKDTAYSIMDLYSEVFDRFFTYDMKYQKNVMNMLSNMLLKHMIIIDPIFVNGAEKEVGEKDKKYTKKRAQIGLKSIEAERFTFKINNNGKASKLDTAAKSERVLEDVVNILYYPQTAPKGISIKEAEDKETSDEKINQDRRPDNQKSNYHNNGKFNKNGAKNNQKKKDDSMNRISFAGIDASKLPKG